MEVVVDILVSMLLVVMATLQLCAAYNLLRGGALWLLVVAVKVAV